MKWKTQISCCHKENMSGKPPNPELEELRIMLVGLTGGGRTSSMNTLLGRPALTEPSPSSQKTECKIETVTYGGQQLVLIDTPGVLNTDKTVDEVKKDIVEYFASVAPGPHVILFVLTPYFTKEDDDALRFIRKIFGEDSQKYTMALFTRADEEEITDKDLENEFIGKHINRYHCFDNTSEKSEQVPELLKKINAMVKENKGEHYTNEMLKKAQEVKEKVEKSEPGGMPSRNLVKEKVHEMLCKFIGDRFARGIEAIVNFAESKLNKKFRKK